MKDLELNEKNSFRSFHYKNYKWIFFVAYALLLLFLTVVFWAVYKSYTLEHNKSNVGHIVHLIIPTPTAIVSQTNNISASLVPTVEPKFTIQRKVAQSTSEIFEFKTRENYSIVRWKDFLFFTHHYDDQDIFTIYQHDIKSGETKIIFQTHNEELIMSDLTTIGDTLYFSLGAYMRQGKSYWIDLSSEGKNVNNLINRSGDITQIKNRYYFITGSGDACWGKQEYSFIDLNTKRLTHVADTVVGCIEGDEYIGINNNDQMILAGHGGGGLLRDPNEGYNNMVLIPLTAINERQYLTIPLNSIHIKLLEDDSLLVIGLDKVSIYNLKTFETIVYFPKEWLDFKEDTILRSWDSKRVCIDKSDDDYTKKMHLMIDLDKKTIIKNDSLCPLQEFVGEQNSTEKIEKIFRDLRLPPNYILVKV